MIGRDHPMHGLLSSLLFTLLAAAPELPPSSDVVAVPGERQRPVVGPQKRGVHELKDPSAWPAEPPSPTTPLDTERFDAAVVRMCAEVAPRAALPEIARVVRTVSQEVGADPFLMAALVYREGRCRANLTGVSGIGLLQIKPSMFAARARLPFPREALDKERLLDPEHNLRVGAALLAMWEREHVALDAALGSTPHRTALAHLYWGDRVWASTTEDRTLTARRRLLEAYNNAAATFQGSTLGLDIVSPLEGAGVTWTSAALAAL